MSQTGGFSIDKFLELSRNEELINGNINLNAPLLRRKKSRSKSKDGSQKESFSIEDLLSISANDNIEKKYNMCETCKVPMELQESFSYECPSCGFIFRAGEESCQEIMNIPSFDSKSGGRKYNSSYSGGTADYSKIQRGVIKDFLNTCFDKYYGPAEVIIEKPADNVEEAVKNVNWEEELSGEILHAGGGDTTTTTIKIGESAVVKSSIKDDFDGKKIPRSIIPIIVERYMDIIKLELDDIDNDGSYIGKKKFVKRGNVKKEIIGALIYYECLGRHIPFNKKEIASLLFLQKEGIAHGEEIIRSLAAESKIELPKATTMIDDYIDRYFIAITAGDVIEEDNILRLPEAKNCVREIVAAAKRFGIGINMIDTTRITGSIWFLSNTAEGGKINYTVLEEACLGVKKNTFQRFSKDLTAKMDKFRPIIEKYGFTIMEK